MAYDKKKAKYLAWILHILSVVPTGATKSISNVYCILVNSNMIALHDILSQISAPRMQ